MNSKRFDENGGSTGDELSIEERDALRALRASPEPPRSLEEDMIAALRSRGFFTPGRGPHPSRGRARAGRGSFRPPAPGTRLASLAPLIRTAGAVAAVALAFVVGAAYERRTAEPRVVVVEIPVPTADPPAAALTTAVPEGPAAGLPSDPAQPRLDPAPRVHWSGHYCEMHGTSDAHLCALEKTGPLLTQIVVSEDP